jgi:hypothetical protein
VTIPWTATGKSQAVTRLRRMLNEQAILFEVADDQLQRELLA